MFSPITTQKEANRFAIAWLASVIFLFVSEYMYDCGIGNCTYWEDHTIASFCYTISNAPLIIMSVWIAAKALYQVKWIKYIASLIIDWSVTCIFYAFRNPNTFNGEETIIIVIAVVLTFIKLFLYRFVPRFRRMKIA